MPTDPSASVLQPWQRPWYWCAPGEWSTLGWIIALHLLAAAGLILLPLPSWPVLAAAGALIALGGLGTTVVYHRALSHCALALHPLVEQALILCAVGNGSGTPRTWVAMHRLHHATSDRHDDISSPHHGGFWWSHLRWLWQADQAPSERFAKDLHGHGYRFWSRAQVPVLALSLFGGLLWPGLGGADLLTAALWLGPLRLLWALHAQCAINSICHLGEPDAEHGSSRNVWWLTPFLLGQGENWHANHHRRPSDARLGRRAQIDVGWWTISVLRVCRLASRVRLAA